MTESAPDGKEKGKAARRLAVLGRKEAGAGITFGVAVALFTIGGWWLDSKLGSRPAFLLVGLFLGATGGFIHLVETISPGTLFKKNRRPPK